MDEDIKTKLRVIKQSLAEVGMPLEMAIMLGKYCELALQNPNAYPQILEMAVKKGLVPPNSLSKKPDYQILTKFMVIGKSAELIKKMNI